MAWSSIRRRSGHRFPGKLRPTCEDRETLRSNMRPSGNHYFHCSSLTMSFPEIRSSFPCSSRIASSRASSSFRERNVSRLCMRTIPSASFMILPRILYGAEPYPHLSFLFCGFSDFIHRIYRKRHNSPGRRGDDQLIVHVLFPVRANGTVFRRLNTGMICPCMLMMPRTVSVPQAKE